MRRTAAAAGFDPNRGTPAQVAAENAYLDELDAQYALLGARTRAKRSRREAAAARSAGFFGAGLTLLQGGASALSGLGPFPKVSTGPKPPKPIKGELGFLENFESIV